MCFGVMFKVLRVTQEFRSNISSLVYSISFHTELNGTPSTLDMHYVRGTNPATIGFDKIMDDARYWDARMGRHISHDRNLAGYLRGESFG